MTTPHYWLIKSEPDVYPFSDLIRDKHTVWDGVRNYQARNNLRAMAKGDICLFYHSGDERAVVGIAEVIKTAYPDPSAEGEDWSAVDVKVASPLKRPVPLSEIKAHPKLKTMTLVTHSRLSVSPVTADAYKVVIALSKS